MTPAVPDAARRRVLQPVALAAILAAVPVAAQLPLDERARGAAVRGAARAPEAGQAGPGVREAVPADRVLADRVFARLAGRRAANAVLDVTAEDGVVTLAGALPSEAAKRGALRRTLRIPGVRDVRDRIVVAAPAAAPEPPPPDAELARRTAEAIAAAIPNTKAGEDWWFSGWRVEAPWNYWSLVVEADRGSVVLEGEVPDVGVAAEAVRAARAVSGVRGVDSQLEIEAFAGPTLHAYPYRGHPQLSHQPPYAAP